MVSQGIINWGSPVASILEDGELFIQQARSPDTRGLVSVLLEGKFLIFFIVHSSMNAPYIKLLSLKKAKVHLYSSLCIKRRLRKFLIYFVVNSLQSSFSLFFFL